MTKVNKNIIKYTVISFVGFLLIVGINSSVNTIKNKKNKLIPQSILNKAKNASSRYVNIKSDKFFISREKQKLPKYIQSKDVLIEVKNASLGISDIARLEKEKKNTKYIPCQNGSGVVVATGNGVNKNIRVGAKVYFYLPSKSDSGACQSYVFVNQDNVKRKPLFASMEEASLFGFPMVLFNRNLFKNIKNKNTQVFIVKNKNYITTAFEALFSDYMPKILDVKSSDSGSDILVNLTKLKDIVKTKNTKILLSADYSNNSVKIDTKEVCQNTKGFHYLIGYGDIFDDIQKICKENFKNIIDISAPETLNPVNDRNIDFFLLQNKIPRDIKKKYSIRNINNAYKDLLDPKKTDNDIGKIIISVN